MTMDDAESGLAALIENLQRQDLDFLEEAMGISRLIRTQNLSQEQAARMLGKSQSAIANKLRLLRHSPQVLTAIQTAGLSERHARALLRLPTEPAKMRAIETIAALGMSVSRTEQYIDNLLSDQGKKQASRVNLGGFLNNLTQSLARIQAAGISAVSERRETEREIVLTITIPK
jgi:ParB family chromosome partitioning protein